MLFFLVRLLALFVKVDPKVVLFVSFGGKSYSDNPRYLFEYMQQSKNFADYHFIWGLKKPDPVEGAETVKFNSIRYFYWLSKAKYWVFNSKMAPYYYKKPGQVYLQTWHGTPLKHLGHDIEDNGSTYYRSKQSYSQMVRSYDNDRSHWDYLVSPNAFSTNAFVSAFGISKDQILELGYPRVDCLVNASNTTVADLKRKYGIPAGKKVVLYAPTWRDNSFGVSGYTLELQVDFYRWRSYLGDDYVVLFKPHYLISNNYHVPADLTDFVFLMNANADINDAYLMTDVLVTDYSSVFFDFAVLGRPIYFYMYDFDEYENELRGFYLKIPDDLPNDIDKSEEGFLEKIRNEDFNYDRLAAFNQGFNVCNDGQVCKKVIGRVFSEI
ncbi:CDP-glycerol glycerophosphotransferase [Ligilactobacillus acidipiscis]|uniref:CDP-glycerol glycerophosphotransferase n=2 Tax=Ligilactobacillus acidipiscis TaxID=89059 RepID=A0A0R2JWV9_9LACO|nr:CDP-glycerol glycerophosphotransferase [Ligilactobacillus acidipiscis]